MGVIRQIYNKNLNLILFLGIIVFYGELVLARGIDPGETIYAETMANLAEAREKFMTDKERSQVVLKGAGKCRDEGSHRYTILLFEEALYEDPTNARVYRVYADYLMGYRGLYEDAGVKLYRAKELLELSPNSYGIGFKRSLANSLQIWHRDGKDGVPLILDSRENHYSIYFEPSISFTRSSSDHEDPLSLFELQLQLEKRKIKELNPGDSLFNAIERDINQKKLNDFIDSVPNLLPRRRELVEKKGSILIRANNEYLPYVRLAWSKVSINNLSVEPPPESSDSPSTSLESRDGEFKGFSALIGKNLFLAHDLDANFELEWFESESTSFGLTSSGSGGENSIEESGDYDFDIQSKFTHYFHTNTLKLTLGGNFRDIARTEGGGENQIFSDSSDSQRIILRLSMFLKPGETEKPTRFRGRRSNHYELGFRRNYRDFKNEKSEIDKKYTNYWPHTTMEFFGLLEGHLDLSFHYNYLTRKEFDFNIGGIDILPRKGVYDTHQWRVTPTWIFKYDSYNPKFKKGVEFLSAGIPTSYTLGEKSGSYSRFNTGIKIETQIVLRSGIRLVPTLEADYGYYPELDVDDWGGKASISLRY